MTPAIKIRDLEWKYGQRKNFALQKVNLEIEENSVWGIVGANEHGKTTLVSSMCGLIPHSHHGVYRGEVQLFGTQIAQMNALQIATKVGFVFADPEAQFTAMTVEEEFVFGLENLGLDLKEIAQRLAWAADITKIGDLMDKSPYDISGGQKQRVAIASVLAMNPPVIIMDEPTSMLDPFGKQEVFDILRRLKDAGDHTLIVVEHNLEQLAPLADYLLLMVDGQVDMIAEPREFFRDPSYLVERGVPTPETTAFAGWLKGEGFISSETPLPLEIGEGITVTLEALNSGAER